MFCLSYLLGHKEQEILWVVQLRVKAKKYILQTLNQHFFLKHHDFAKFLFLVCFNIFCIPFLIVVSWFGGRAYLWGLSLLKNTSLETCRESLWSALWHWHNGSDRFVPITYHYYTLHSILTSWQLTFFNSYPVLSSLECRICDPKTFWTWYLLLCVVPTAVKRDWV